MRVPHRRWFALALAATALAGSAATAGDDLIACRTKGQIQVLKKGWTRISAPPMSSEDGPRVVTAFTTAPHQKNTLYATNGKVIKRSADAGCTWDLLLSSSNIRVPIEQHQADIFTHLAAPSDSQLWAASYDDAQGVNRPHIHLIEHVDKDATLPMEHSMVENGLPAVGKPVQFLAATSGFGAMYLMVEQPPDPTTGSLDPTRHIYTTVVPSEPPQAAAIGIVWQELDLPASFGAVQGMATAPDTRTLWIWSADAVGVTTAANADDVSWKTRKITSGTVVGLDVSSQGQALVAVAEKQGAAGITLDKELKDVSGPGLPVTPVSMTHGNRPATRAVSGPTGTFGFDPVKKKWLDITPANVGPLQGLQMAYGRVFRTLMGRAKDAIYRYDLYDNESFLPDSGGYRGVDIDIPDYSKRGFFSPTVTTVTVEPGEIKKTPVVFDNPAAATPLNVYFLVDTTTSMQNAINSLREDISSIAGDLRKKLGPIACFGVGDFKDFDTSGALDVTEVFQTRQRIECEKDASLPKTNAALKLLKSTGGGDDPEAQTVALDQMMTGAGNVNPPVRPGADAGWQPGAYKVVVLISDAPFKQESGYPSISTVGTRLKNEGIKVVSVLVQNKLPPEWAREDMTELAIATDSEAPPGGVDCDGDGQTSEFDVSPGDPLICQTSGSEPNIGPVIVSLLLGVEDPGTIAVDVADPYHVVREPIDGTTSKILNLKREASLRFRLPVSCTEAQLGRDLPVELTPTVRALPVPGVTGKIIVRCRRVDPVDPPPPPPPPKVIEPEPFRPPAPRPPAAIPVVPPNPPVQPISNLNMNAGFSQQEEQQFQLATVAQGASEETQEEEPELAMVGLEQDTSATPVAAFLAGAAVISAAAAVAYRRRLQRATNPSYIRD